MASNCSLDERLSSPVQTGNSASLAAASARPVNGIPKGPTEEKREGARKSTVRPPGGGRHDPAHADAMVTRVRARCVVKVCSPNHRSDENPLGHIQKLGERGLGAA